ncbi:cytochrome P450 [Streptomyces sp. WAC06614]|uniref:cytochrome P450 n=1 Tax=Streptomyces sp. WAC06614 TaxID=2487416 RepID=UPI000F79642B|nr:cytochrome P450 [Streptomyces sp. WAC06614]RSS82226.1 cytochrome P450 [Streptomyces sp. WAC06614]
MRITSGGPAAQDGPGPDLSDPRFYGTGDPHPVWARLRAEDPVHRQCPVADKPAFWAVTRYADVSRVLARHGEFTAARGNILTTLGRTDIAGGKMLAVCDPPLHRRLKEPLVPHLSRPAVRAHEPALREFSRRLLSAGARQDTWDFAAEAAFYPVAVAGLLLGVPEAAWDRLKHFTYAAVAESDPDYAPAGSSRSQVLSRAHSEIFLHFATEVARPGRERADDLIGALLRAAPDDEPLSRQEVILNAYSLLIGATVTTSHAAAGGLLALLENPAEYARWRDSGDTPALVEEILRWTSPANHALRHTTGELRLGDTRLGAGEPVTAWLGSANRDESVFPEPFRFAVDRRPNRHIAFGVGAHRCIGAHVARLALTVLFEEIARNFERIELAGEPRHLHSTFIAGIKNLPVRTVLAPDGAALRDLPPLGKTPEDDL